MATIKNKMWDGRFSKPSAKLMELFNNSLPIDKAFIEEDIAGSIAWSSALQKYGVLTVEEEQLIHKGLRSIQNKFNNGTLEFDESDEDIHMAIERLLGEEVGEVSAKLHTGRSRNDQVATDFRLYVKNRLTEVSKLIKELQKALLERAQKDIDIIIPGYTHYQQAQPVSMAHYWLSFFYLLERDRERMLNCINITDIMPLGSGAIAGSGFAVDRLQLAKDLGFSKITDNSIDGVASRDFVLEALNTIASTGINISRYAEDLIVWSTKEFGYIELDDAWSTGSSMMPQKKNPDSLELIRGKSGRLIGNYTRFASTLKGVGLSYFKDLQEDKEPFIDSHEQITLVMEVLIHVIESLEVKKENISKALDPFLLATDIADYLVRKNLPFRQAHHVVGSIVGYCVKENIELNALSLNKLQDFSELFSNDVLDLFDWKTALNGRDIYGGTGPNSLKLQITKAKKIVD
jgi:argininosuccinate lyase